MPAFDSSTNFNATWSNSYGTIVCAPGQAVGAGFGRAAGKTYFEFVVDSQGNNSGSPNKRGHLFLGGLWRGGAAQWTWLFGGDRNGDWQISNASGDLSSKLATYGSMTWSTGDVVGVAVNYSGDGIGGLSSLTFTGQCVIEISKNGVFLGHRAVFSPSGAFVGFRPLVAQDVGTSLSVVVSLRVDSLSFSYAPAGYSEWGQSGGITVTGPAPYTFGWITDRKGDSWTLSATSSGNVFYALRPAQTITASTLTPTARTTALPISNKTYFEVYSEYTTSYGYIPVNFINEGKTTLTSSTVESFAAGTITFSGRALNSYFGSAAASLKVEGAIPAFGISTAGGSTSPNSLKRIGFMYDPTKGFIGLYGYLTSFTAFDHPDDATPFWSITSSQSVYMFACWGGTGTRAPRPESLRINAGQNPLWFPLQPGWYSADLTRYVSPGGERWKTPTTFTTTHTIAGTMISIADLSGDNIVWMVRSQNGAWSGKRYFELLLNAAGFGAVRVCCFGFCNTDAEQNKVANFGDVVSQAKYAVYVSQQGGDNASYEYVDGLTLTASGTTGKYVPTPNPTGTDVRMLFAADFEVGRLWIGWTSGNEAETASWIRGDPNTGTGGITFTASTTLYALFSEDAKLGSDEVTCVGAWQADAFWHAPPTGFTAWDAGAAAAITTTATLTPSFTGCVTTTSTASSTSTNNPGGGGGGFTRPKWPFGIRP
jgi:hypothetical protein